MFVRQLWEATPGDTILHRLDGRTKLIILAVIGMAAVVIDSSRTLFLLFIIMLTGHYLAEVSLAKWRILIVFLLLGIWGAMISQGVFYSQQPRTPIFCILPTSTPLFGSLTGGIFLYREGLEYGAVQALRSGIMLTTGLLICWTSDPRILLRGLLYWRMPYEVAFMAVTSIRFLPEIMSEAAAVITAQRLRGFEPLRSFAPGHMIQTAFQTLFPVLAITLRRATTLALSVESRGFGRTGRQASTYPWPWSERILCVVIISSFIMVVLFKISYSLQYNGMVYFYWLRNVYDFIKLWL
ncbi:MAG TPA: energy-coupling factor transporter transmembrane component T [Negativicutes bacterium]